MGRPDRSHRSIGDAAHADRQHRDRRSSLDDRAVFDDILRFVGSDLLCYRADSPKELVARQNEHWNPIIDWAARTLGARFILVEGVIHQEQPAEAVSAFAEGLRGFATPLGLACLHTVTSLTGSALLALALAMGRLSAEQAWAAAHVDEDWQIEQWGTDEEAFRRRENAGGKCWLPRSCSTR